MTATHMRTRVDTFDLRRIGSILLLALPVVIVVMAAWRHRFIADDGFINFRIVDQIRHGNGPVFNAGERVEVYTSPLWLLFLLVGDLALPLRLEHVAVLLGLSLTAIAFVFAQLGTARLWRELVGDGFLVPAGAVVLAVLPPIWDFATSGLDGSLGLAWISISWWAVCRHVCDEGSRPPAARSPWWLAALVGLGPLVRPDLIVMTVVFLIVVLACQRTWRAAARVLAWAVAVPVAYEIFRMWYFAALVPNTALAKEAGAANWSRGWDYLLNFLGPYLLVLPVVLLLVVGLVPLANAINVRRSRMLGLLVAAPVVAGLMHMLYVVRVGGDFMHGRLLLPSLWCLLLPVSIVIVRSWRWVPSLVIAAWSITCLIALRTDTTFLGSGVGDERRFSIDLAGNPHPVTLDDYRKSPLTRPAVKVRALAEAGRRGLILDGYKAGPLRPMNQSFTDAKIAARVGNIGQFGYAAGPDVYVIDFLGLAEPIIARTPLHPNFAAGHQKFADVAWILARFTAPASDNPPDVRAARRALACGNLRELLDDITGSPRIQNVFDAYKLTRLRIPRNPHAAKQQLCGVSHASGHGS